MAQEIERKFLVRDRSMLEGRTGTPYRQGYLSTEPGRVVRVRHAGDRGFVTIKGPASGASRAEYEYEIPVRDADEMIDTLAIRPVIEKTRYEVHAAGLRWEIDVFTGGNEGLVVAEVELPSEDFDVELPDWAGPEVTGDARYYNASLVRRPYRDWGK